MNPIQFLSYLFFMMLFSIASCANSYDFRGLEQEVVTIEQSLSGHLGVAVLDSDGNSLWSYKGADRVPLTSTFKTIACAKLLHDAETGSRVLSDTVRIDPASLQAYSPVTRHLAGDRISFGEACSATMMTSDNTAANIVLEAVGGPHQVTRFLRGAGDDVSRLDRMEPELNESEPGDIRDTTTPNAMAKVLYELLFGTTLSAVGKMQLRDWMSSNQVAGDLLRSVLPQGWDIADRSGAGGHGSRSITAVVWPRPNTPIIITIYISETNASFKQRNHAIATVGALIFRVLGGSN